MKFPETDVVGVDITPPANDFELDNSTFVTADMEETLGFCLVSRVNATI